MLPGFVHVPYNDLGAVAQALGDQTAAVLVEPIQGEGGINIPAPDYLAGLRQLCDRQGVLLILDEVQTGLGRTGTWFAYQHAGIVPDILTCAKALAGGLAAGVMIARPGIAAVLKPGMHASTFGGNPIACRAALAAIETICGRRFFDGMESREPSLGEHPDHDTSRRPDP
jgi:acetylornithine/succinyldiaminopimelate/putrescine aminotransferase